MCNVDILQVQVIRDVLPYYQLMTPKWLHKHSIITGNYTIYPHYLELDPTTVIGKPKYQLALQVKLVAPGILRSTDDVSVTLSVAMDTTLGESTDHDPSFGISDGELFIGYTLPDIRDYGHRSPCEQREGEVIANFLQNMKAMQDRFVNSQNYSSEVNLQFRPTEKWGSCHTEHNAGYVNIASYNNQLDITKGLYLQMYHEDDPEKYRIKYIVVDVHVD